MRSTTRSRRMPRYSDTSSGLVARVGWGVADQALSSLMNFALGVAMARSVSTRSFGQFGLLSASYVLVLGCSRGLNTEPLAVRYSAASPSEWRHATAAATGAALGMGAALGLGYGLVGLATGGATERPLLALGWSLPGLLLQDSWRFAFISAGRSRLAAANEGMVALLLFPALVLYQSAGDPSVAGFILVWGATGWVGGLLGALQARLAPRPLGAWVWWREHRDLGPRYVGDFLAIGGASSLSLYAIGGVSGLVAVGALRAGFLALGPFLMVMMAAYTIALPEGVRAYARSNESLRRTSVVLSAVLTGAALLWGGTVLSLPDPVGRAMLGPSWGAGRAVLVPLIVYYLASAIASGACHSLRAMGAAAQSLRVRLVSAPFIVVGAIVGAAVGEAQGAAWGMAVANAGGTFLWWRQYPLALRRVGQQTHEKQPGSCGLEPLSTTTS